VIRRPARLLTWLVVAVTAQCVVAAPSRFVPPNAAFTVANVSRAAPDAALRERILAWRAQPTSATRVALAEEFLDRARRLREPVFTGRAEALLAPAVTGGAASADERRLYAYTLQYRHEFTRAEALLDGILAATPRDTAARVQRASIRLVRGDFAGARADCGQLLAAGARTAAIGAACLAESFAGSGALARGLALLENFPAGANAGAASYAYLLTVRAELSERAGRPAAAAVDYAAALELTPESDSVRAALADLMLARGEFAAAASLSSVDRPSLALLVRQALAARGAEQARLRPRAAGWLDLERSRGDAAHGREAAMLALDAGNPADALRVARKNFETQRELPDVRVLARAAAATGDADALRSLRKWLASTGFADSVTLEILAGAARG
jgi:hypothetical protein